jgi:hypothetical protein
MTSNLPVASDDAALAVADERATHFDPQEQDVQQDLGVALIPLALVVFIILAFVVAAWTFLAT